MTFSSSVNCNIWVIGCTLIHQVVYLYFHFCQNWDWLVLSMNIFIKIETYFFLNCLNWKVCFNFKTVLNFLLIQKSILTWNFQNIMYSTFRVYLQLTLDLYNNCVFSKVIKYFWECVQFISLTKVIFVTNF